MLELNVKLGINNTNEVCSRTSFIGREWVFQSIHQWLSDVNGSRRYFLLTREPGAGKTAISDRPS